MFDEDQLNFNHIDILFPQIGELEYTKTFSGSCVIIEFVFQLVNHLEQKYLVYGICDIT